MVSRNIIWSPEISYGDQRYHMVTRDMIWWPGLQYIGAHYIIGYPILSYINLYFCKLYYILYLSAYTIYNLDHPILKLYGKWQESTWITQNRSFSLLIFSCIVTPSMKFNNIFFNRNKYIILFLVATQALTGILYNFKNYFHILYS